MTGERPRRARGHRCALAYRYTGQIRGWEVNTRDECTRTSALTPKASSRTSAYA